MVKQVILIICASVAAIFFKNELVHGLNLLMFAHNQVAGSLATIFSGDKLGLIIRGVISLIVVPAVIGGVLTFAYWVVKKTAMPYTLTTIWIIWTVLLTTLLAQAG